MATARPRVALVAAIGTLALPGSPATGVEPVAFPLATGGKPVAQVVFAGDDKRLAAAVEDLTTYVDRISGAKLEVHRQREDLPGPTLHLGETELFEPIATARERIKVDGFVMAKRGEDLILAGNLPQGTGNAIYTVLQDQFGVRWYYPGELWETVPKKASLTITFEPDTPDTARVVNPSFIERGLWGGPPTEAFGRRLRFTQKGTPLPYVGTGHHLSRVVNPEKFGDHPEYFAYWDGKRHVEHDVHPCFTHPDMLGIFVDAVRRGESCFGVNDNLSACKCERCLAVDGKSEPYMGMWNFSESFFQLMKRVAAEAKKIRPGHRLGVFAYQLTNSPPKTVDFIGDNVDVVLCQDTAQYFDPEVKATDQRMSAEWVSKCGHVRFYDYIGINYWVPRYFPHILADQLKHLARVGVVGYGTHGTSMPDSSMPMFYLLYQMLWDVDLDPDDVIGGMITDLYGEAAPSIRAFYDHWEQCWQRQKKGRWFWGMDNFRGEMEIYTWADIERGRELLDQAAAAARDDTVKQRIHWLQERFAFTYASARAYTVSTEAILWTPTGLPREAIGRATAVRDAWREWYETFKACQAMKGPSLWGWLSKTFRVRAWGLKQQMRDAITAPMVRWACTNETRLGLRRLESIERHMATIAIGYRRDIEPLLTEEIEAHQRRPRADALIVANVPATAAPIALTAAAEDWPDIALVDALPWHFHIRPADQKIGKYEEPMPQNYVDAPPPNDQSMRWQCAWDDRRLYLRVVVTDDRHVQDQPAAEMWKEDSVQIAFNPQRDNFVYELSSWDYIWGGYHGEEAEFGIALRQGTTEVHVWRSPPALAAGTDARSLIEAKAARHGSQTVYEAAIDWRLLPGFPPKLHRSFGICIVVNDVDDGVRRSAEYGSGVIHAKRPTEFAGMRLVRGPRPSGVEAQSAAEDTAP